MNTPPGLQQNPGKSAKNLIDSRGLLCYNNYRLNIPTQKVCSHVQPKTG
ncbi:MAG: hypothetical protein HS126_12770 [Anaerolineales bacterium]|nr:hypothetical protein [Anaerolineales bacterium]